MLTFQEFLVEHVLNIGLNADHESHREKHRQEIHDIIHSSYKSIDGYRGHASGSTQESDAIHHDITHSMIKAVKRDGRITAVQLYKHRHGRKIIAAGTDGTPQGKSDFIKINSDDHTQKRAWGEVSGKVEHLMKKAGHPAVSNKHASHLTGKPVGIHDDGEHYNRMIGDHEHTKTILGHPKINA